METYIKNMFDNNDYKNIVETYSKIKFVLNEDDSILFGRSLIRCRLNWDGLKFFKYLIKRYPENLYLMYCASVCAFNTKDYFESYFYINESMKKGYSNKDIIELEKELKNKIYKLYINEA